MLSWEQHPKCLEGLPKLSVKKNAITFFMCDVKKARKPEVLSWEQHPKCLEGLPKLFKKHVIAFFMCDVKKRVSRGCYLGISIPSVLRGFRSFFESI